MLGTLSKSRKVSDSPEIHKKVESSFDFYGWLQRIVWPVIPEEQEKSPPPEHRCAMVILFNHVKPEYSAHISDLVSDQPVIETGKFLDAVSLLSCNYETNYLLRNNGDRVELKKDAFKGKTLMICCFNVPVFRADYYSTKVQAISNICSDLFDLQGNKFEMVVVAKMHSLANHKEVFDHFLSGFPASCLTVPFTYSNCRDYICKYLDLGIMFGKCLIVDGCSNVLYWDNPNFAGSYGAEAFPFTQKHMHDTFSKDFPLWKSHPMSTLEGLLQCDSSAFLDKTSAADGLREKVSISKFKEKVVGLYLFVRGDFLVDLNEIYEQCRDKHLEFEIVLVYLPFMDSLDPQASQVKIDRLLQKHNISWCRVPYNDSVSRRLWRLITITASDVLVILGPGDTYVDCKGRKVMRSYGISGYPFTREELVKREIRKMKEPTLESLLVYGSRNFVFKQADKVPVEQLKQKNILLYFGCLQDLDLYYDLQKWYDLIKEKSSSFEVVFIRRAVDFYAENTAEDDEVTRSLMPWLVCPFDPVHSNFVQEKLFTRVCLSPYDTLVQFGTDGRICSFQAHELIRAQGTDAFPFKDNLRQDVISRLESVHGFMSNYQ